MIPASQLTMDALISFIVGLFAFPLFVFVLAVAGLSVIYRCPSKLQDD